MSISLRVVNKNNYDAIVGLDPGPVSSNVNTLAKSVYRYPDGNILRAVYLGAKPIGLFSSSIVNPPNMRSKIRLILRMMIDVGYQSKGYGTTALKKYINLVKRLAKCKKLYVSYDVGNMGAERFYRKNGFEPVPMDDPDANVLVYKY